MTKTYDSYKDSGIAWIGNIPSEWNLQRLKFLCTIETGNKDTQDAEENGDFPFYVRSPKIERSNTWTYEGEGILMAGDGAGAGRVFHHAFGKYAVHQRVYRLANFKIQNTNFLFYYLSELFAKKMDEGSAQSTVPSVRLPMLTNFTVCLPNKNEQQAIASFLDNKCKEIDACISLQEEIISELQAYKQSLITKTVTKGLNSNAKMKDSGIEWIGMIPERWRTIRIKWLLNERKERSITGKEEPLSMSQKFGLIPTREMDTIPNMASSFVGAKVTYKGDLVFNKLKAHLGVFSVSKYYGLVSPDYAVYFSSNLSNAKYLEYLFKTPIYINEFRKKSSGVGAGLTRLYTKDLFSIPAVYPPKDEQIKISNYIDEKTAQIDSLIAIKQEKISELKDYKKSIIYEYVTGKKRV